MLMSLNILKIACDIGKAAGVAPLVLAGDAIQIITDSSSTLTSMYDELKYLPELESTHTFIEKMCQEPDELNRAQSLEGIHGAIAVSEIFEPPDPHFLRSGLVLATDDYGVSEYVHKDIQQVVEKHGFDQCLQMSTKDLGKRKGEILEEATKKKDEQERLFREQKEKNEDDDKRGILFEGYMEKKGVSVIPFGSRYNKRYFILKTDGTLFYYMSESDVEKGTSAIHGCKRFLKVVRMQKTNEMEFKFENPNGERPITQKFRVLPNQNDDCNEWVKAARKITRASSASGNTAC